MKIEVRPLRDTDIEELSRIEAASFSMPWSAEDFRGLLLSKEGQVAERQHRASQSKE